MSHAWGKPNSNTTVAATIDGDATKATIFGYDTGAAMVTGTAAAPRVGFMYYGGNGATHFNDNAAQLFDASIQWAAKSAPHIEYQRDATDRITSYTVNGVTIGRYAYTASADTPALTLNAAGTVTERTISLPGGVLVTTRTAGNVWSYPNLHGDVVATTDNAGVKQGATRAYDPFGNLLGDSRLPDNSAGAFDYGWHGQQQRPTNHQTGLTPLVEMGARQYSTQLGRFLETDPIRGGVDNDYNYPNDPINQSDTTGLAMGLHQLLWCNGQGLFGCLLARSIQQRADELFIGWEIEFGTNTAGAMKHFYWIARTTKHFGSESALALGRAHEADGSHGYWDTHRDLANNMIGANFVAYSRSVPSNQQIAEEARRRATGRGLICVRKDLFGTHRGLGYTYGTRCK